MPFPRKMLGQGEEVVLDFHPHWIFLAKPFGWTALWLIVYGGRLSLLPPTPPWCPHWIFLAKPFGWTALWLIVYGGMLWLLRHTGGWTLKGIILLAVLIAWAFTAGVGFLRWRSIEYVLTSDRLIVREGILSKKGHE